MIEDRLRELRLEEPRLVLDLDDLVARAAAVDRQRRSVLATTLAVLLTAAVTMVVGALRDGPRLPPGDRNAAATSTPVPTGSASTNSPSTNSRSTSSLPATVAPTTAPDGEVGGGPPAADCVRRSAGLWSKVVSTHLPGADLRPLPRDRDTDCPVYRLPGGDLLLLAALRPGAPVDGKLVGDKEWADGGRLRIYRATGRQLVRWGDGRVTIQAAATGGVGLKALIAIATDPVLRSEDNGPG
ncbi:serine/threonine-protein kinase [Actinophytocola xanthii]|uniref:Uncharacterized protein n=1 Tax=Actinophytocola xanthii TaxID=1912961 RepID=A0A1Q8CFV3_9PSEU|nr:hypothetical protein [Actinophytocola xanthii]OLF13246.1 hypothetical protein BU204_28105 [Actinophytocola xanthii]